METAISVIKRIFSDENYSRSNRQRIQWKDKIKNIYHMQARENHYQNKENMITKAHVLVDYHDTHVTEP